MSTHETVTILSTDTDDAALRSLAALSLERLGCEVHELIVRSGSTLSGRDPVDNPAVAAALLHSDLVIDLTGGLVGRSDALEEILDEARVLVVDVRSSAQLDGIVTHAGLAKRVEHAGSMLRSGETARIASLAGTSLRVDLAKAQVTASAGQVKEVGDFAHWPGGQVWASGISIDGTVVAMPGDMLVESRHILRSAVRIELQRGLVVEVLGDTIDADALRSSLEANTTETAFAVAAFGWGLHLARNRAGQAQFDLARLEPGAGPCAAGVVNLRLGAQAPEQGLTLCLSNASVTIDHVDAIVEGSLEGSLAPDVYELAASA